MGTIGASDEDVEAVYLRAFPFSLAGKAKTWLQSHPNKSLNTWEEVEEAKRSQKPCLVFKVVTFRER